MINLADLDAVLKKHVVEHLDHSFLNYDVDHFERVVPTCENIAAYVHAILVTKLGPWPVAVRTVRVWEGEDLYAEVGHAGDPA